MTQVKQKYTEIRENGSIFYETVLTFERVFDVNKHRPNRYKSLPYTHFGFEINGKRTFGCEVPMYPAIYSGMTVRILFDKPPESHDAKILGWFDVKTKQVAYYKPLQIWFYMFTQAILTIFISAFFIGCLKDGNLILLFPSAMFVIVLYNNWKKRNTTKNVQTIVNTWVNNDIEKMTTSV